MSTLRRLAYHTDKSARRLAVTVVFLAPLARWILYRLHAINWGDVWNSIEFGVVCAFLVYFVTFIGYWFKRKDLDNPPRMLSYRKRKKITDYLRPWGQTNPPAVSIWVCQGVKDGMEFAQSIREALVEAKWMVVQIEEADCRTLNGMIPHLRGMPVVVY
jgi:hypothetical protein